MERWIPLTQYALEEGVSISTLRRKIKSNSIEYRLDNGRYLIRSESEENGAARATPSQEVFAKKSNDSRRAPTTDSTGSPAIVVSQGKDHSAEITRLSSEMQTKLAEMDLKWRALEVRINGLAKKVDFLIEQNSELNMLVKVFEEKLDATV